MAKGKQAAALFDVIHASKRPPKASPGASFPTPRWWGKGKAAAAAEVDDFAPAERPTATPPAAAGGGTQRSWLAAARRVAEERAAAAVAPASPAVVPAIDHPSAADGLPASLADDETEADERLLGVPRGTVARASARVVFPEPEPEPTVVRADPAPPAGMTWARPTSTTRSIVSNPLPLPTFGADSDDDGPSWGDDPTVGRDPTRPFRPAERQPAAAVAPPVPAAVIRAPAAVTPAPALAISPRSDTPTVPREASSLSLDRSAQQVRFRLTYPAIAAVAAGLALTVAAAFLAGRHSSAGKVATAAAAAQPSGSTSPSPPTVPTSGMMVAVGTGAAPRGNPGTGTSGGGAVPPAPTPPPVAASAAPRRQVGSHYVVLFFGAKDRGAAETASRYFAQKGVPCTVVRGPRWFAPIEEDFSVVGTQPFNVDTGGFTGFWLDPEQRQLPIDLLAYRQRVVKLYEQFTGSAPQKPIPGLIEWTARDAAAADGN